MSGEMLTAYEIIRTVRGARLPHLQEQSELSDRLIILRATAILDWMIHALENAVERQYCMPVIRQTPSVLVESDLASAIYSRLFSR